MKIKKLQTYNFKGLKGFKSFDVPALAAIVGKNGTGKTTFLEALRLALTGQTPTGNIINAGSKEATVSALITDPDTGEDLTITKIYGEGPAEYRVNTTKTTLKSIEEKLAAMTGVSSERAKIASSSDVLTSLKPAEFASVLFSYIKESNTRKAIIDLIPDITDGEKMTIEAELPESGITLEMLEEFNNLMRFNRKSMKADLSAKKGALKELPLRAPETDREALKTRLAKLSEIEATIQLYKKEQALFETSQKTRLDIQARIDALENSLKEFPVDLRMPEEATLSSLKETRGSYESAIATTERTIGTLKASVTQLEKTKEALEGHTCPISPLITCHEDKTVAKEDIARVLSNSAKTMAEAEDAIKGYRKGIADTDARIAEFQRQKEQFGKKQAILDQIDSYRKSMPAEVSAPVPPSVPADTDAERGRILAELGRWESFDKAEELRKTVSALEQELKDIEALVKATDKKGPVRTAIVSSYLGVFEKACNEAAEPLGYSFRFEAEDGITVYMKNKDGAELPYQSLSGGEKAVYIYVLLDMLNRLSGFNILLLDELSVLDGDVFRSLIQVLKKNSINYDHIIITAVDHPDTIRALNDVGITILTTPFGEDESPFREEESGVPDEPAKKEEMTDVSVVLPGEGERSEYDELEEL